jgi:ATP-dependent Lon protease
VNLGDPLSGRDIEVLDKTVRGLTKLRYPEAPLPEEDLESVARVVLKSRWRVKKQQKRCFKSEFRNTQFSYTVGPEGVEQFDLSWALHSDEAFERHPPAPLRISAASDAVPKSLVE